MTKKLNQNGFTILELLIATMVFAVIFSGAVTAILQIGKLYYKGVVSNRVQETTRSVTDAVSQELQFNSVALGTANAKTYNNVIGAPGNSMTYQAYCIGTTRFSYKINAQVDSGSANQTFNQTTSRQAHGLWRDTIPNPTVCVPPNLSATNPSATSGATGSGGTELLGDSMRLSAFDLSCDSTSNVCKTNIGIIYGDNDLLKYDGAGIPVSCNTIVGSQWCAASQLTTSVLKRVGVSN